VTGRASTQHELKFNRGKSKHKQIQESFRSQVNQPITRSIKKKQPIKASEIKRW